MADTRKSSVAAIASDLGHSVAHTRGAAENPDGDLFAAFDAEAGQFEGQAIAPPKRSAGRPPGSPNRSTLQLQRFLMARGYRDPAEFLAATVSIDARALAAALAGHDKPERVEFGQALEALKVQRAAAAELLPYFHQRLPQAVHHTGDQGRPVIMIVDGAAGARLAKADGAMSIYDAEEFQQVSADDAASSHGPPSHETGKDDENQ